jgi:hypothetical protein
LKYENIFYGSFKPRFVKDFKSATSKEKKTFIRQNLTENDESSFLGRKNFSQILQSLTQESIFTVPILEKSTFKIVGTIIKLLTRLLFLSKFHLTILETY